MTRSRIGPKAVFSIVLLVWTSAVLPPSAVYAQVTPGGGGVNSNLGGIEIDADGTVQPVFVSKVAEELSRKRREAQASEQLSEDLNRQSPLRSVSLVQLEHACEEHVSRGEEIPVEMRYLAGLLRIDYVFVYPETGDLVIAGPAEGFAHDENGGVLGCSSGRPPLRLDDFVVALRASREESLIGCSIDPVPERLLAVQKFIRQNSSPSRPDVAKDRYRQMAKILGMQDVFVFGVPADSNYARVLVEADYRMKLISMGLEKCNVRGFRTHLSMLTPQGNSLQRWWFSPLYDAFYRTEDGNAYQISGQRVQLSSQQEVADAAGRRHDAASTKITTIKYALQFTDKFPEIAEATPIFAELQNVFDMAILAALFRKERLPEKAGWTMSLFLDPGQVPHQQGDVPKQVHSVFAYKFANRNMIIGLVGGGVEVRPRRLVRTMRFASAPNSDLGQARRQSGTRRVDQSRGWWWD